MEGHNRCTVLYVYGSFVVSALPAARPPPALQQERQHYGPALQHRPLSGRALALPEVGGGSRGDGVELLGQQPHLPQERQRVHAHQDHHPELRPEQGQPHRQAAAARGQLVEQVTHRRGDEEEVCDHHGEDEEEEEAVVTPADAAVEEKAVVVVVFDAQVAQLAVFGAVGQKQLRGGRWRVSHDW